MKQIINFHNRIFGFTLAEVLITLGIIGIVAEITIPTLYHDMQEQNFKVAYKTAFSSASQAWQSAVADYKIESRPTWADEQSKLDNFAVFKSYFKIAKDCPSVNSDCWSNGQVYYGSYPLSYAPAFIDASGMAWSLTCPTCGAEILVDTNGFKSPNRYGQDRFILYPVIQACDYFNDFSSCLIGGTPIRIMPVPQDYLTKEDNMCPSGDKHPCLYKSWLYN